MKAKLYNLMNWAAIEGIVYSEEDRPGQILGPHKVGNSCLYQAFFPDAEKISLVLEEKEKKITMEQADEEGFFAAAVIGDISSYYYEVKTKEGKKVIRKDPYAFSYELSKENIELYEKGILYDSWKYFGSRRAVVEGQEGIGFCVHVPGAMRVSLVGDFCHNDGRVYPMNRIEGTEIFTLFFPDFSSEDNYCYEVKKKDDSVYYLNDPYGCMTTEDGKIKSKLSAEQLFSWDDWEWMLNKKQTGSLSVYSFGREEERGRTFFERTKKMGFTHILLPKYEPEDFFYQYPEGFSDSEELKNFVNSAHQLGMGVLFQWRASRCRELYRKEKINYYISNMLFLLEEYHFDGMVISGLEELFYLDYGKIEGSWTPNIYGGNENLDGIELIKHAVSVIRRDDEKALLIASIDALWWGVTKELSQGGLGFDYCIDLSFTKQVISYLNASKEERPGKSNHLIQRMEYAKEQNFIMSLDKEYLEYWTKEEEEEIQIKLIRLITSYMTFLPGCSINGLLFPEGKHEEEVLFYQKCCEMKRVICSLAEDELSNFHVLREKYDEKGVISFMKTTSEEEGTLLVLANFSEDEKDNLVFDVPLEGKYELLFDTNVKAFGGEEMMLPLVCKTREKRQKNISYEVSFRIKPYTVNVYRFLYFTEEEILNEAKKRAREICLQLEEEARQKIRLIKERKSKKER